MSDDCDNGECRMTAATTYNDQPDLGGFDEASTEIILTAIGDGWVVRRSKRGHMIMRAPDGKTTTSISNNLNSKRRELNNAWAPVRRYQKQAGLNRTPEPEPEMFKCEDCDYTSDSKVKFNGHLTMNHNPVQVCEYGCGRSFHTKASYALHVKAHVRKIEAEQNVPEEPVVRTPEPTVAEEVDEMLHLVPAVPVEEIVPTEPVAPTPPAPEVAPVAGVKELTTDELTARIATALAATYQLKAILDAVNEVPPLIEELTRRHGEAEASLALMGELFDSIRGHK